MKYLIHLIPLILTISTVPLSRNNTFIEETITTTSILNYDPELGVFKDLTKEEVKDYYSDLSTLKGLKGDELLQNLQPILREGHKKITNRDAWHSDWHYFLLLDRNYEEDPLTQEEIDDQDYKRDNVIVNPLYTDDILWVRSDTRYFDREHMWPKSRGFKDRYDTSESLDEQPFAATDMHNLRMGERKNNQEGHNNYPFGEVLDKEASTTIKVSSTYTQEVTGYRGYNEDGLMVFEPRDEDKGDIARGLFYMAARYSVYQSTEDFEPALKLVSSYTSTEEARTTLTCDSTKTTPATYGLLDDLLKWHNEDPVDEYEIHRNNLCYNIVQGNRNPFVDYPAWANVCFDSTITYGIDLSKDNGIEDTSVGIVVDDTIPSSVENGKALDELITSVTFTSEDGTRTSVPFSDPRVTVSILRDNQEVSDEKDYIFEQPGNYEVTINFSDNDQIYSTRLSLSVQNVAQPPEEPVEPEEPQEQTFLEKYGPYLYIGIGIVVFILVLGFTLYKATKKKKRKKKTSKKK